MMMPTQDQGAVLIFPLARARPSKATSNLFDAQVATRCFHAASVANRYRATSQGDAVAGLRTMGVVSIANLLEENALAITTLRAVLASLLESDRRIAAAADALLRQQGL